MATFYSQNMAGQVSRPIIKAADPAYGANVKRFRSVINMAAVATSTYGSTTNTVTTSDSILLAIVPGGYIFDCGEITSSVTLGTSVVAIGTNATHASNGQYRAAATFTSVDTPTRFGLAAAKAGSVLTADTNVWLTLATASLPTSGTLVIDLYFNKP